MQERFIRTERILGSSAMDKLKASRVAVFGVGGVGGYVVEALVRSGIGAIDVFDNDTVAKSNLNRQIIALETTIGMSKVEVAKDRALSINPDIKFTAHNCFYGPHNADDYDLSEYSYIVDAIDTVISKLELIRRAKSIGVPIISSMGTGNKLEASMLEVADIKKTEMCPLARTMRRELKKLGITELKVVYSKEKPIIPQDKDRTPSSMAFVPGAAGLIIAGEVIKGLIQN